jgi:hypothetical protein
MRFIVCLNDAEDQKGGRRGRNFDFRNARRPAESYIHHTGKHT